MNTELIISVFILTNVFLKYRIKDLFVDVGLIILLPNVF